MSGSDHNANAAAPGHPVDAWHDHSHDVEHAQHPHAEVGNVPLILGVGIGLFLVIVAAVVMVDGFYAWYATERLSQLERTDPGAPALQTRAELNKQRVDLDGKQASWIQLPAIDKDTPAKNVVQLPVARVEETVVDQYVGRMNGTEDSKK